jgi:high-affinity Fe2+/Pb2+ permease
LEAQSYDGPTIITLAGATALGTFVAVTLGGEGLVYAVRNPQQVVASQFLLYFLAAGLIGTGLGYWGINHWQELVEDVGPGSGLRR